jgi:DNA-binding transcriptional regulator WhiA
MKPKTTQRTIDSFFNTWTPDKAYVLGYFAADGSMYKNKRGSCYISFTSADEEQITLIKNILRVSNQIEIYQPKGNCKLRYTLQVGSKVVYKKFLALGLVPNKSLILTFPKIPDIL